MNNNSQQLTFWKLIQSNKIEIPIIQRDYAQGRPDKKEVRENFLNDLLNALSENEPLELDFVYGDIHKGVFQPLDGQQRLTTLFLLHWYVAVKENKLEKHAEELSKFTYETRASSREFCTALINNSGIDFHNLLPADYIKENELSKTIIDRPWFLLTWQKDPTVKAMLIMLDAIHEKISGLIAYNDLWGKLTEQHIITFHHLTLEGFGLSDDLYIKMNARGKALTDFENFKAKFEQHIQKNEWEKGIDKEDSFPQKIDTVWTDLFWLYRNNNEKSKNFNLFDREFMNFFRIMAINYYAANSIEANSPTFGRDIDLLRDNGKEIPFNKYVEIGVFDEGYLTFIKCILTKLSKDCTNNRTVAQYLPKSPYVSEEEIFNKIISNNLAYADLITIHGFYQFLANEEKIDTIKLEDWMRVIRNLVEGSRPYNFNSSNEFAEALKSISSLLPFKNDILHYLSDTDEESLPGFLNIQFEEEKLKAKLILKSEIWKDAIVSVENHKYFKGQIDFLLDWCKKNGEPELDLFNEYTEKVTSIFSDNGLKKFENYLFERALLASGNYLLKKGRNYSFLVDNERDISWKRLVRDNNEKRAILKNIFDNLSVISLADDLQKIIDNFNDTQDWKYNFIKQPEIISNSGRNKLIRWNGNNEILVLGSSTTSGYHLEYFSYSLFLRLKDKVEYISEQNLAQRSRNYSKSFSIGLNNEYECSFEKGKYKIVNQNQEYIFDSQEIVFDYFKKQGVLQ